MRSRIITPGGLPAGNGEDPKPENIGEKLNSSLQDWNEGRKHQAFTKSLQCVAILASGVNKWAQMAGILEQQVQALHVRVTRLEAQNKPASDANPPQDPQG